MQLQKTLLALPAVLDAGVVMGTAANKQVLEQSALLTAGAQSARAEDLVITVRAENEAAAEAALAQVDRLLTRHATAADSAYRPRSLESAVQMLPPARWVLVSVPGRYAASVARDALCLGRHVFLYSDNVSLEEEIALKQIAQEKGLIVMGPDCGTAIINGTGLGFANRVRRGRIGLVGAAGTGLQAITVRIHQLGAGISHAIGTGTRDLSDAIGAVTARQGLGLLSQDPETEVIVLLSKPPSPTAAAVLLGAARAAGKPVVVDFIGYAPQTERGDNLHFARTLSDAAERAVALSSHPRGTEREYNKTTADSASLRYEFASGQRYLRGLYAGGTLAYEAQLLLRDSLGAVYSNAALDPAFRLPSPNLSRAHTILDLGADEFTVGRLHPMLDNDLRIRRLRQEADDPEVAVIVLDVVLGYGTHPDPASELAPAITQARDQARRRRRHLEVIAVVIATDEDPQNYDAQAQQLRAAGARVESDHTAALRYAGALALTLAGRSEGVPALQATSEATPSLPPLTGGRMGVPDLAVLQQPFAAINVGLESFYESLKQQGASAIQVDWRPPAGGNERLMAILEKLKRET
jgi:FdrA protein